MILLSSNPSAATAERAADADASFPPIAVVPSAPPLVGPVSHGFSPIPSWGYEPASGALTRERQVHLDRYSYEAAER